MVSALALLIPTVGTIVLLAHPGLPLWPYLVCATLAGVGGGNFASSMTNINAYYPQRLKGWALGSTPAPATSGVPIVQLVGLLVLATAGTATRIGCARSTSRCSRSPRSARRCTWTTCSTQPSEHLREVRTDRHTWVIALLYIGTFGSFIGFCFAFGQVLQIQFVATGQSHSQAALHAAEFAFVGPALGSLARIYGGRLADRVGGSRVTLWVLLAGSWRAAFLVTVSTVEDHGARPAPAPPPWSATSSGSSHCSFWPGSATGRCTR